MITHLYIKTHNQTGLKYFGKTIRNPQTYRGSGIRWTKHIKKHGYDVTTTVVASFDEHQKDDMVDFALSFSEIFDIVNSESWANLIPEDGLGGINSHIRTYLPASKETMQKMSQSALRKPPMTEQTKNKISQSLTGRSKPPHSLQHRAKISESMSGANHPNYGKRRSGQTRQRISASQSGENGYWFGKSQPEHSQQKRSCSLKERYKETRGHKDSTKLKIGKKARGTTHITNGTNNKRIDLNTCSIPEGFYVGYTKPANKLTNKGKRWITNGAENRCIHIPDNFLMPDGFLFGKSRRSF